MSWQVELKRSGRKFVVEDNETVLAAALRQQIGLPYGCRDGACGSCRARLLSGEIEYGKQYPTALAGDGLPVNSVILCQARPKTDLLIDVGPEGSVDSRYAHKPGIITDGNRLYHF